MSDSLPVIRINQSGYAEQLPVQVAVLSAESVNVSDQDGNTVKTVKVADLPFDEASGDNVKVVNLGKLPAGEYTEWCGTESRKVSVKKNPRQDITNALIK